jgi:hypothetical protein
MVAALALGACNAGAPALSDPTEILTKAIEALQSAKTVHLAATVDGTFTMDLTGQGGGAIDLVGTTFEGDIDIEHTQAKLTFAVPSLLNLNGEVIAVDGASYVKTSLTGAKYQKTEGTDALPIDPKDTKATLAQIKAFLEKPEIDPQKGNDVDCDGEKCYSITIEITAAEMAALSSPDPSPAASLDPNTAVNLTILVEKDSVKVHKITAAVSAGTMASVNVALTFTKWDEALTIVAPPADQIGEGTGLPFP